MTRPTRILLSLALGVFITMGLTAIAFAGKSRQWLCTFAWQGCLTQQVIHTPDNPMRVASPIDLLSFLFGLPLGVPVYGGLAYAVLSIIAKLRK